MYRLYGYVPSVWICTVLRLRWPRQAGNGQASVQSCTLHRLRRACNHACVACLPCPQACGSLLLLIQITDHERLRTYVHVHAYASLAVLGCLTKIQHPRRLWASLYGGTEANGVTGSSRSEPWCPGWTHSSTAAQSRGLLCYTEKSPNAWHRRGTPKTGNTYHQPNRPSTGKTHRPSTRHCLKGSPGV